MVEMNDKNPSRFTLVANWMDVKEEVINAVNSYFYSDTSDLKTMITSYHNIGSILTDFTKAAWNKIVCELVVPGRYTKPVQNEQEVS